MPHQDSSPFAFLQNRRLVITTIVLLLLLTIAATAYASWHTIDTNDHAVDSAWSSIPAWDADLACNDSNLDDKYEMAAAYVTQDGDSMYYRLDTCAIPNVNYIRVFAAIDCNNDGDVVDPLNPPGNGLSGDRILVYR
ncbi:MAG TPA: hypothetical protein G4N94_02180, partial [Caldilineae bacterium]|nr:hypothetical protein [Caldilineae bacterium]